MFIIQLSLNVLQTVRGRRVGIREACISPVRPQPSLRYSGKFRVRRRHDVGINSQNEDFVKAKDVEILSTIT